MNRLAGWAAGGLVAVVVAWSVLQPTTVHRPGLGERMAELVAANRPVYALYAIDGDGPPLGEPHDWYVVASDGNQLARIDLTDGDITGYELEGYPQVVIGDRGPELVLAGPAPQPVYSVTVGDPAGPRRLLFRWPIDGRDPVNNASYAVERIDGETVRVAHIRQDGVALVPAVVDIDLVTGEPAPAAGRYHPDDGWLARWAGKPTATSDDGRIIAGPASRKRERAVLIRQRGTDSFHNPVPVLLPFRPETVVLVPKPPSAEAGEAPVTSFHVRSNRPSPDSLAPAPGTTPAPAPETTAVPETREPTGAVGSIDESGPESTVIDSPRSLSTVPDTVLDDLRRSGYDYLLAANHQSFHRMDLATGTIDRFDLGVRVVGVASSSGGDVTAGGELIGIRSGSAVVALPTGAPGTDERVLLELRDREDPGAIPMAVRVTPGKSGTGADIHYWDPSADRARWRRLALDLAVDRSTAGPYRVTTTRRGVVVTDRRTGRDYLLPLTVPGGASTVLLV